MSILQEAKTSVEDYIRKNRKSSRLWKNAVGKEKDSPVSWLTVIRNIIDMMLENQLLKTFIPLFIVFVWNTVSVSMPEFISLNLARWSFLLKTGLTLFAWNRIKSAIETKVNNGEMEHVIQVEKQEWTNEGKMETVHEPQSIGDYDKEQLQAFLKQQAISSAIVMVVHFQWGYTTPLVVGTVMSLLQLKDQPLYRIYVNEEDPTQTDALKRPYKTKDFMSEWQRSMQKVQAMQEGGGGGSVKEEKKISTKSLKKAEKAKAAEQKKIK